MKKLEISWRTKKKVEIVNLRHHEKKRTVSLSPNLQAIFVRSGDLLVRVLEFSDATCVPSEETIKVP